VLRPVPISDSRLQALLGRRDGRTNLTWATVLFMEIVAFLVALAVLVVVGLAATGRMPFPRERVDADGPRADSRSGDPDTIDPEDRTAEPPGAAEDAG
jgi:hypothetical protein